MLTAKRRHIKQKQISAESDAKRGLKNNRRQDFVPSPVVKYFYYLFSRPDNKSEDLVTVAEIPYEES